MRLAVLLLKPAVTYSGSIVRAVAHSPAATVAPTSIARSLPSSPFAATVAFAAIAHLRPPSVTTSVSAAIAQALSATSITFIATAIALSIPPASLTAASTEGGTLLQPD